MAERSHEVFNAVAVANSWTVDYLPMRAYLKLLNSMVIQINDAFSSVKYLPAWLPGMGFKRLAKQWRDELDRFAYAPYEIVKSDVVRAL